MKSCFSPPTSTTLPDAAVAAGGAPGGEAEGHQHESRSARSENVAADIGRLRATFDSRFRCEFDVQRPTAVLQAGCVHLVEPVHYGVNTLYDINIMLGIDPHLRFGLPRGGEKSVGGAFGNEFVSGRACYKLR